MSQPMDKKGPDLPKTIEVKHVPGADFRTIYASGFIIAGSKGGSDSYSLTPYADVSTVESETAELVDAEAGVYKVRPDLAPNLGIREDQCRILLTRQAAAALYETLGSRLRADGVLPDTAVGDRK